MYTHYGKTTISAQLKHLETFSNPIKPYGVIYNPVNQTDITDEIKNKYVVKECEAVKHNCFIILQCGDISKESEAEKKVKAIEIEHSCVSCKFGNLYSDSEPCCNCTDDNDMFEPIESENE